jgi:asparagine synthase (glutamine-hydrolysing)
MGGIAGAVDLNGRRKLPTEVLQAMADALVHRGPDEEGFYQQDGISLAARRLSIVGVSDGQQPVSNESGSVLVVCNGELFDDREQRSNLEARGHKFQTRCDTEILPHAWEEHGERMFDHLHGQFAFALWDNRQRRLILARDRFGICPLYWTRQGDWLLFASEIKALLASGLVPVRPDLRGINQAFTFFAMPGPMTSFEGVSLLLPGHYLDIRPASGRDGAVVHDRTYWEIDFPNHGEEDQENNPTVLVNQFEEVLQNAVEKRLRADVPVASYLSGGVDSSIVVAMANKVRGQPIPTFTIRIDDPALDETSDVSIVARHVGCYPSVVHCGAADVINAYPRLVHAVESPVLVTSCAAMLLLAERVRQDGYKVALTGEGADDWLAGYSWYKVDKLLGWLDVIPGLRLSQAVRRGFLWLSGAPTFPREIVRRTQQVIGGHNGWLDVYGMMGTAKLRLYGERMRQVMLEHDPYADLQLNQERLRRWHPFNRSLYLAGRIHLPGLLLNGKNDRVAMHSSVETRLPFLDEKVFTFLARLHPRWKIRGFRDKYLLRLMAERWLPREIVRRRKVVFRAPSDSLHVENPPAFVHQLLSRDALLKTAYFDPDMVTHWSQQFRKMRDGSANRSAMEMGLAGVLSTQLWHHLFVDSTLCELPAATHVRQTCSA